MAELWFGQSGVTISQHADSDDRFPGWQETFGEGTYLGNDDFPNDDASHIQVDDGFKAILREHGPSDDRYPGREITHTGPKSANLSDFNDQLSEIEVQDLRTPDADNNQDSSDVSDDDVEDMETDGITLEEYQAGLGGGSGSNTMLYVIGGIAVLAIGYMIMKKKK